jgi:S1-C subfamily serine protease
MVGRRARIRSVLARALAVVVPIVLVCGLSSLSVGFFARRGAAMLWSLASRLPESSLATASMLETAPADLDVLATVSDVAAVPRQSAVVVAEQRRRSVPHKDGIAARRGVHRIHVGPDMVRRALPVAARPVASWTDRGQDRPAGMMISSPGALAGTIQVGDILFEAEGRPFASFEHLVAIVGQAYQRRAKIVSGRLWRRGEVWTITVEPGWIADSSGGRE